MPNYANNQLYELIEHDEEGNAHVYRGRTTQPLHKRLGDHRSDFRGWTLGVSKKYCSSFEVLKYGQGKIEFVRDAPCSNRKEANRLEGEFIRELPTCVNILKNKNARNGDFIWCECGSIVKDMRHHIKTRTHRRFTSN